MNTDEITLWLRTRIAAALGLERREVDATRPLIEFGVDSTLATTLAAELEGLLGKSVDTTLLFEYPTIADLARALGAPPETETPVARVTLQRDEPIAVVGMACRFPGASNVEAFWDLMLRGATAVGILPDRTLPPEQWPGSCAGGGDGQRAAVIESVDRFDRRFFRINEAEALAMDPQNRLLLELSWEALEDACIRPSDLAGSDTGVFIGITGQEYGAALSRSGFITPYFAVGNAPCMTANRISYFHDLRGPSVAVDAACASSLTALALACKSLRTKESSMALVGAANVVIAPELFTALSQAGMLARDGRCKSFDAAADGYVRGEGAAVVVLKPLAQAVAAGDPIHAVIRGIAINQDGRTNGLTAPNAEAHRRVLRDAYRDAGMDPATVQYVEAHGTGTALGDQIEAESLAAVLGAQRRGRPPCLIGSVKANIGHLEAASGMAGLLKTILALRNGWIPGHANLAKPNPKIPFGPNGLELVVGGRPWADDDAPRRAGVSSFGFGGSNAHCVLEQAPDLGSGAAAPKGAAASPVMLTLSAYSRASLLAMAQRYELYLRSDSAPPLADVARTAALHRDHGVHRMAVVGETREELAGALALAGHARSERMLVEGNKSMCDGAGLAFVFTGQGAQWAGMGQALRGFHAAFDATFDACIRLCERAGDISLRAAVETGEGLDRTDVCQPVIYAIQLAFAALWRSWGVLPGAVVGHSVGEIAAAVVAGVLTEEEGAIVVAERSRLMHEDFGRGLMVAINMTEAQAEDELRGYGELSVAAVDSPDWVVVAGERDAVVDLETRLAERDVAFRRVPVKYGFHSPRMDAAAKRLASTLGGIHPSRSTIPLYSTVTGQIARGDDMGPSYWARAVRQPIRFWAAMQAIARDGFGVAIQVGPDAPLERPLRALASNHTSFVHVASMRRGQNAVRTLLDAAARLYVTGATFDLASLYPWEGPRARLPAYAWDRESFWAPTVASVVPSRTQRNADTAVQLAAMEKEPKRAASSHAAIERGSRPEQPTRARAFESVWHVAGEAAGSHEDGTGRRWMLIGAGPAVETLGECLRREGAKHVESYASIDAAAARDAEAVVDLRALMLDRDANNVEIADACQQLVLLANLLERHATRKCRLFHLTRGARAVPEVAHATHAAQATVAGAARAIPFDQSGVDCTRVDADPTREDCWERVARLLLSDPAEDDYILRGDRRLVPRLRERSLVRTSDGLNGIIDARGSYLVTGGLGGLGQMLAGDIVDAGARRLILMGRRPPSERAERRIAAWRAAGVDVVVAACDVSDESALARAWNEHDIGTSLSGVFHVAGLYDDAALTHMTVERMANVLSPKVAGTRNILRLTEGRELDFIVLYSSAASAVGTLGGVNYAAANAYLDAVATGEASGIRRLLAVNWGPWAEVGMAAGLEGALAKSGIDPIVHEEGIAILGDLLRSDARQVCVLGFDPSELRAFNPAGARAALLSEWAKPGEREDDATDAAALAECLGAPSAHERRRLFRSLMASEFARPLGLTPDDIDPSGRLQEFGMDSLTIAQVRVRLQAALGIRIPIRLIWESESFQHLSDNLCDQWASAQLATSLTRRSATRGECGADVEEFEL